MIDLHAHTSASDGSLSAVELIVLARQIGLEALAITDHDTFAGFDEGRPFAVECGLDLVCGIELSTKYREWSVHLLGYFPSGEPGPEFREWVVNLRRTRDARNEELLGRLAKLGIELNMGELIQRPGQMVGRPHIALLMVKRGYVETLQQAFDEYLCETGCCYVERQETPLIEAIERIDLAGGVSSLAHPCRVSRDPVELRRLLSDIREKGLRGIEIYHSDHSISDIALCSTLCLEFGLLATGGSDFHGASKPEILLGRGRCGQLEIPRSILECIRSSI
jgi:predicted metal-dependent phosphoesterase TrpH